MKIAILSFILVGISAVAADAAVASTSIGATALQTRGELESLAHACELVRAINVARWPEAESMIKPNTGMLPLVRRDANASKDWHGIGAYRGTERKAQSVRHRFGYGPGRNHPHELWITYSVTDAGSTFESIFVLGW
ncbi:MAG: hypothetical protein M3463_08590 [Verrucomicrobiota bacterium]|nr:hypothetical protein [Verrucomicrobiota bacterium]